MAKQMYYRQCRLRKKAAGGFSEQISYIPEPYCVKNRVLKLRDQDGVWDDGWVVAEASTIRTPEDAIPNVHKEIKEHRRATGDAMKK